MRSEFKKFSLILLAMTTFLLTLVSGSYGQSVNYYYDDLNRLTRIDYGDTVIDYTYDDVGNRLTESILHPPLTTPSPTGGVYGSSQSVTLTCSDPQGPGCGNIYYTTDGSTPTTSSPVYSAPISISATTTLKYFARDVSNPPINESVKSQTYTIDTVPPTGTVTVNAGAESTTTPNVTLTLTCSDANGCSQGVKPCEISSKMAEDFVKAVKSDPTTKNLLIKLLERGGAPVPTWLVKGGLFGRIAGGLITTILMEWAIPNEAQAPTPDDLDFP